MPPRGRDGGHRTRLAALAAAALAACTGVDVLTTEARPHEPPRTLQAPRPSASAPGPAEPARTSPLAPSRPTTLDIPSIDVHSKLLRLGLAPDGALEVPRPPDENRAGWYTGSVTPGERGTAVILGHLDSTSGASVFYRLGDLGPGRRVRVHRADGTTAVFTVDAVRRHPKGDFPAKAVYGHTPRPSLRLITCGGAFDDDTGHYLDNIVVYAHLTAVA
ncbi:class F sortase [Actinomadura algeriensis]|uniref:Sortase (Surface protein transpeptidase) n=1 Tax=Actinomadura algeriensis TaxID=1679523 RepID=A0ABR9JVA4_9ACTN|nr:class F sortase [Actinomadura algeriensis]MBE1534344.1 sortase (surface protein transpeptidase) [Actinomadura algeriensis]